MAMDQRKTPAPGSAEEELLRADRDLTREELGRTVAALSGKLDVRGRAEDALHQAADNARQKATELGAVTQDRAVQLAAVSHSRAVPAAVAVAIAALIAWLVVRNRAQR